MDDQCCYVCNECPNSYTTLDELETHMDAAHAGVNTSGDNNSNNSTTSNDKDNRNGTSLPEALLTQQLQQKQQQSDDEKQSLPDESKDDNMDHDGNEPESGGNSPSSSDVSNFDGGIDGGGAYGLDESMNGEEGKGFGCRFCPKIFEERSQVRFCWVIVQFIMELVAISRDYDRFV
ncbi:unnamed protein product [Anisakis simplex]|uniref:C2H2-type domain-containing protein n=1 Tax=Anisakis simplex TaxID=6269 RepID=A0A0M3KGK1_ANISI|nr:unnamed protein product [Anisakis simplex]